MSRLPFIWFPVEMNEQKNAPLVLYHQSKGTKRALHSIKGITYEATTYT